jgi:hypothetical protein
MKTPLPAAPLLSSYVTAGVHVTCSSTLSANTVTRPGSRDNLFTDVMLCNAASAD